jgi:preprotein translocase subunit SecA
MSPPWYSTTEPTGSRRPARKADRSAGGTGDADGHLLVSIARLASSLQTATVEQLADETCLVRRELSRGRTLEEPELLGAGLSLACEALRRAHGVKLYDVQLVAAIALIRRRIVQMQTGEGKTCSGLTAAAVLGMAGRGVHVATPNAYLAERDQQLAAPVLSALGMSAGLLPERTESAKKAAAYDCDVTYGTGHEFGFDYLRDQLTLRQEQRESPGTGLLRRLRQGMTTRRSTLQRGLEFAIVDEADSVLMDDAGSPLVLSLAPPRPAEDAAAHLTALELAARLVPEQHFVLDPATGVTVLTSEGVRRSHSSDVAIPVAQLVRPWSEYVQQALRARYLFRRDVHYVINDQEVRIVDETTGRIFEDRSWQDGLHQAIEAREGLTITAEKESTAQITRQRFYRLYGHLCGMTGTATGCEREFAEVYGLQVQEIPLRIPSARQLLPIRYFSAQRYKWQAITEEIRRVQLTGRPVLAGTRSIADSEQLAERLQRQGIAHQLLNGMQNAAEAGIIERAGQPGAVTIATNLAGRGTDIVLSPEVRRIGGLHVIVAECQTSGRMDRQLIGRCGRQGDPGSARIFVSAEDGLLTLHGPWLSTAICREADAAGESHADFSAQLQRIQSSAERQQRDARLQLLLRDNARDILLSRLS